MVLAWDGCNRVSDNIEEGGVVWEGKIMDNLMDVVEGPSASLCNRGDFEGTAEWGETLAGEHNLELNGGQEGHSET